MALWAFLQCDSLKLRNSLPRTEFWIFWSPNLTDWDAWKKIDFYPPDGTAGGSIFAKNGNFGLKKIFTKLLFHYLQLCFYVPWPFFEWKQANMKICLSQHKWKLNESCNFSGSFRAAESTFWETNLHFSLVLLRKCPQEQSCR